MSNDEVDFEGDDEMEAEEEPAAAAAANGGGAAAASSGKAGGAAREVKGSRGAGAADGKAVKVKGRGHTAQSDPDRYEGRGGVFETVDTTASGGPLKSVEGWLVFVRGVHAEAQEDDVLDAFSEYGDVKNINVNLDRRTGYVKGYALVEFEKHEDAAAAIKNMDGYELLGQALSVDWAFVGGGKGSGGGGGFRSHRSERKGKY